MREHENGRGVFMGHVLHIPKNYQSYDERVSYPSIPFAVGGPGYVIDNHTLKVRNTDVGVLL